MIDSKIMWVKLVDGSSIVKSNDDVISINQENDFVTIYCDNTICKYRDVYPMSQVRKIVYEGWE
jgi:hypothetical protein